MITKDRDTGRSMARPVPRCRTGVHIVGRPLPPLSRSTQGGERRGQRSPPDPEVTRVPAHRALQPPRAPPRSTSTTARCTPCFATKLPGLRKFTMSWPAPGPDGAQPPYHLVAALFWDSGRRPGRVRSPEGEAAVADLPNFAGAGVDILPLGPAEAVVCPRLVSRVREVRHRSGGPAARWAALRRPAEYARYEARTGAGPPPDCLDPPIPAPELPTRDTSLRCSTRGC